MGMGKSLMNIGEVSKSFLGEYKKESSFVRFTTKITNEHLSIDFMIQKVLEMKANN